jgi:hypothetical protein
MGWGSTAKMHACAFAFREMEMVLLNGKMIFEHQASPHDESEPICLLNSDAERLANETRIVEHRASLSIDWSDDHEHVCTLGGDGEVTERAKGSIFGYVHASDSKVMANGKEIFDGSWYHETFEESHLLVLPQQFP